ncbi:MAG: DUF371 domain-containing protein [Candidatus Thorarchaeota archaeon]|nr:DUF371 domain-containing protein [Candidatus Thorarchaeota archaeon]
MRKIRFTAYGHENVIGDHKSTIEITSESHLTKQGTCIIGVRSNLTLLDIDAEMKNLAKLETTTIVLIMEIEGITEQVTGTGSKRLTYSDSISMVTRTSLFECGRTLMVKADKAASDLNKEFINHLKRPDSILHCEIQFINRE